MKARAPKTSRKFKSVCKFEGIFPDSRTKVSYSAELPAGMAIQMATIPVKAFRQVMAETYPEMAADRRPKLRKIIISLPLP